MKNGKISKEMPEAIRGQWKYWLEDDVIKAAIENPDKDPNIWDDGFEISSRLVTTPKFHFLNPIKPRSRKFIFGILSHQGGIFCKNCIRFVSLK